MLLVEADGAKRKPLKVPAEHEPVIPEDTDMVIGIAGASAIGRTIKAGCHRGGLVGRLLGKKLSEILTEEDVMTILKSKAGQKKHVKQKYRMVIGQADLLTQEQVEKFKKRTGDLPVFKERRSRYQWRKYRNIVKLQEC